MATLSRRAHAPKSSAVREVLEVHTGQDLVFAGYIVVEKINGTERILGFAQAKGDYAPYENDEEEKQDRKKLLRVAEKAWEDPEYIGKSQWFIDYRQYGSPTSTEEMPLEPYEWHLYTPGKFKEEGCGRQIFPYCPIRMRMMEASRDAMFPPDRGTPEGSVKFTDPFAADMPGAMGDADTLAILIVRETRETWFIREVDRLLVIGGKGSGEQAADEMVVVDAGTNTILLPSCYSIPDLGEAVWEAIDTSTTRRQVNGN